MTLALYRAVTTWSMPLIRAYLMLRKARGKEDRERFSERCGVASLARPDGPLVWLHAASVGESLSMLPLIERLRAEHPNHHVLVTTGTVTSAQLMAERLPQGAFHQYVPVDRLSYVRRFFNHWRPDLMLWAESEFWPNLLTVPAGAGVPIVLVNGRVSPSAVGGWRRFKGLIAEVMACFSLCLGQTETDCGRLRRLGGANVKCVGNIKFDAPPLPANEQELAGLRAMLKDRPSWLASSTHPGEEEIAGRVHSSLKESRPHIMTVIVPRHPKRGAGIAKSLSDAGLIVARRSAGQDMAWDTDIYVADTIGELGLFYRLCDVVFMGKSLVPLGGQNPLEAARLDGAIVFGPHMANFADIAAEMKKTGAAIEVADSDELAQTVGRLIDGGEERSRLSAAAHDFAAAKTGALDAVMAELSPFMKAAGGETDAGP